MDLYLKGRVSEAEYYLKRIIKSTKSKEIYLRSLFWLGQIYYSQNKFYNTIKIYKEFLSKCNTCKNEPVVLLKLGISYLRTGKKEKALYFLKNLIKKYPKSKEAKKAKILLKNLSES